MWFLDYLQLLKDFLVFGSGVIFLGDDKGDEDCQEVTCREFSMLNMRSQRNKLC